MLKEKQRRAQLRVKRLYLLAQNDKSGHQYNITNTGEPVKSLSSRLLLFQKSWTM